MSLQFVLDNTGHYNKMSPLLALILFVGYVSPRSFTISCYNSSQQISRAAGVVRLSKRNKVLKVYRTTMVI